MSPIRRLMALFAGHDKAYGTYQITGAQGEKSVGTALTLKDPVTEELWAGHLRGALGIGIVPIREDNTCLFGAIDIDKYSGMDAAVVIRNLREHGLPLIPCRSKSGGLHLYCFAKAPVRAGLMMRRLREMTRTLKLGTPEVFPKQDHVLWQRGDIGSWINMPWFDADNTTRYGYTDEGQPFGLEAWLTFAESMRVDIEEIGPQEKEPGVEEAPPCLRYYFEHGIDAGGRNVVMFAMGVYYKKVCANSKDIQGKLMTLNDTKCSPPLGRKEIYDIYKSTSRKEYFYSCKDPALASHCDKALCKMCRFGVGETGEFPVLKALTKFDTRPPQWFINVEDSGRLELTTDDLHSQSRFQKVCISLLNLFPPTLSTGQWRTILNTLFEGIVVIPAPPDASIMGQLEAMIEAFCTGRVQARSKEEILIGKPWRNEEGRHVFRLSDLTAYIHRQKFNEFEVPKLANLLREKFDGKHSNTRIKNKGVNLWSIKGFESVETRLEVPEITSKEPI